MLPEMSKSIAHLPALALIRSNDAAAGGQMSRSNRVQRLAPLGGRGRGAEAARRVQVLPVIGITRDSAAQAWSGIVRRRCGSRENCAVMFGVTFQTACNWWDAWACPTGDKVMQAQAWWPEDFGGGVVRHG